MRVRWDGVGVRVGDATLLAELDLDVASGEILGLVGPNGSGKSTALRCVYRALRPSTGVVWLDDLALPTQSLLDSARSVAALTQDSHAELDFTVAEVVALGRAPHLRGNQALGERDQQLCAQAMRRTDVTHLAQRSVLTLSGGERQRVLIARALAQDPKVLVLDEPTNHLDLRHQLGLLRFLRGCGLTVLIALHDLNLAAATCDRIAVLARGQLVAHGQPVEVVDPELVRTVFGTKAAVVTHPDSGVPQLLYDVTANPEGTS
ncbi:iron complex transport system ATP-binding protein [Tamaricihabitans halophyticus]|uniref:Iron complex transport system ATP-binding protein n=1 Tax=Tamaricihabitans halophyticus TaxID=1262583 RepID=A0A4R2R4S4_9PSEU|nr:ABC transporter ATP-binding protein [Tamaricihabitans halophyticus]TCP54375.1 iron complex transport system ATP-binding protein [Tamaricihabitans halophyticus]